MPSLARFHRVTTVLVEKTNESPLFQSLWRPGGRAHISKACPACSVGLGPAAQDPNPAMPGWQAELRTTCLKPVWKGNASEPKDLL